MAQSNTVIRHQREAEEELPKLKAIARKAREDYRLTRRTVTNSLGDEIDIITTKTAFGRYLPQMDRLKQHAEAISGKDARVLIIGLGMYPAISSMASLDKANDIFEKRGFRVEGSDIPDHAKRLQATMHLEAASALDAASRKRKNPLDWKVDVLEIDKQVIDIAKGQTSVVASNMDYIGDFKMDAGDRYVRDFMRGAPRKDLRAEGPAKIGMQLLLFLDEPKAMVAQAVRIPDEYRERISYENANAEKTDLGKGKYDAVFLNMGSKEYLSDNDSAFANAIKATKMGGIVFTDLFDLPRDGRLGVRDLDSSILAASTPLMRRHMHTGGSKSPLQTCPWSNQGTSGTWQQKDTINYGKASKTGHQN